MEKIFAISAPIASAIAQLSSPTITKKTNAGMRCRSATSEDAKSSAARRFLTPIFKIVLMRFTAAAKKSDVAVFSYKNPAIDVKLIREKNT